MTRSTHRPAFVLLFSVLPVLACSEEPATAPPAEEDPVPPVAVMRGSVSAYIDADGTAPLLFTSAGSEGDISDRTWWVVLESGDSLHTRTSESYAPRIAETGTHTVHLRVTSTDGLVGDTSMAVEVHPSLARGVEVPMILYRIVDEAQEVYTVEPPQTGRTLLMTCEACSGRWDWSPDGQRLATTVQHATGYSEVVIVDRATLAFDTITDTPLGVVFDPRWNPGGGLIAYTDDHRMANVRDELMVIEFTADGHRRVIPGGEGEPNPDFFVSNPSWSPDGTRLAASSRGDGSQRRVWIYEDLLGEATRRRLTTDQAMEEYLERQHGYDSATQTAWWDEGSTDLAWSPDPEWIAFSSQYRFGSVEEWALLKARVDGSEVRRITRPYGLFTWSPDGNWIYINPIDIVEPFLHLDMNDLYRVHAGGGTPEPFLEDALAPRWF